MITGELKSKVGRIRDTMASGGISNPLSVIEQLTYLLFIKRLDELHTLQEKKAVRVNTPIENAIFSEGINPASRGDPKRSYQDLRWSRFRDFVPEVMFEAVRDDVCTFVKTLGGKEGSTSGT